MADEPFKPKGWFSRKHPTREEHDDAREQYMAYKSKEAKRFAAEERNKNTPIERTRAYREGRVEPAEELLHEVFGNG